MYRFEKLVNEITLNPEYGDESDQDNKVVRREYLLVGIGYKKVKPDIVTGLRASKNHIRKYYDTDLDKYYKEYGIGVLIGSVYRDLEGCILAVIEKVARYYYIEISVWPDVCRDIMNNKAEAERIILDSIPGTYI